MLGTARAASANMFCRALSNNSYEGWSRDSRMISLAGVPHHPSRKGYESVKRHWRSLRRTQVCCRVLSTCRDTMTLHRRELKALNASTAMAHHAALAPNVPSDSVSLPPARSL